MLIKKRWYIGVLVLLMWLFVYSIFFPKKINLMFLIPEDYSGLFYVAGSIPGEKPLKKEEDWYVVEIGKYGSARTCMNMDKGGSLNFYIVTKSGERKKAPSDADLLEKKPEPRVKYVQGLKTSSIGDEFPGIVQGFYGTVEEYNQLIEFEYPKDLPKINPDRLDACD